MLAMANALLKPIINEFNFNFFIMCNDYFYDDPSKYIALKSLGFGKYNIMNSIFNLNV